MDKAKFTSHLILLSEINKSVSKDMGKDITVLELSYILNQSINPLMAITYKEKLDKINTFELDPIEVLKKRKNLKILKVLNLMLVHGDIRHLEIIESQIALVLTVHGDIRHLESNKALRVLS